MIATVLSILSVVLAVGSLFATWYCYRRGRQQGNKIEHRTKLLLDAFENADYVTVTRDVTGEPIGIEADLAAAMRVSSTVTGDLEVDYRGPRPTVAGTEGEPPKS